MTIAQLMTPYPKTLSPNDSIEKAALLMRDGDYGAVPLVDAIGSVVGIVTDRDIVIHAVAEGRDAKKTPISHCMTPNPDTVGPDTTVEHAMHVMASRQIRRLVVVENGRLVGMVALGDLASRDANMADKAGLLDSVSQSNDDRHGPGGYLGAGMPAPGGNS